jgi:hypothetical protein
VPRMSSNEEHHFPTMTTFKAIARQALQPIQFQIFSQSVLVCKRRIKGKGEKEEGRRRGREEVDGTYSYLRRERSSRFRKGKHGCHFLVSTTITTNNNTTPLNLDRGREKQKRGAHSYLILIIKGVEYPLSIEVTQFMKPFSTQNASN